MNDHRPEEGHAGAGLPGDTPHDAALRALYRQLPPEEPRAEIDAVILAAARHAVNAAPVVLQKPLPENFSSQHPSPENQRRIPPPQEKQNSSWSWRTPRWQVPFAVAATMLLTFVIVREEPAQYVLPQEIAGAVSRTTDDDANVLADRGEDLAADVAAGRAASVNEMDQAHAPEQTNERDLSASSLRQREEPAAFVSAPSAASASASAPARASGEVAAAEKASESASPAVAVPAPALAPTLAPASATSLANVAGSLAKMAKSELALPASAAAPAPVAETVAKTVAGASTADAVAAPPSSVALWPFDVHPGLSAADACARLAVLQLAACGENGMAASGDVSRDASRDASGRAGASGDPASLSVIDDTSAAHELALLITPADQASASRDIAAQLGLAGWRALTSTATSGRYQRSVNGRAAEVQWSADAVTGRIHLRFIWLANLPSH